MCCEEFDFKRTHPRHERAFGYRGLFLTVEFYKFGAVEGIQSGNFYPHVRMFIFIDKDNEPLSSGSTSRDAYTARRNGRRYIDASVINFLHCDIPFSRCCEEGLKRGEFTRQGVKRFPKPLFSVRLHITGAPIQDTSRAMRNAGISHQARLSKGRKRCDVGVAITQIAPCKPLQHHPDRSTFTDLSPTVCGISEPNGGTAIRSNRIIVASGDVHTVDILPDELQIAVACLINPNLSVVRINAADEFDSLPHFRHNLCSATLRVFDSERCLHPPFAFIWEHCHLVWFPETAVGGKAPYDLIWSFPYSECGVFSEAPNAFLKIGCRAGLKT